MRVAADNGLFELRVLFQDALHSARLSSCLRTRPTIRVEQEEGRNLSKAYRPFSRREQPLSEDSGTSPAEVYRRLAGSGEISKADAGVGA